MWGVSWSSRSTLCAVPLSCNSQTYGRGAGARPFRSQSEWCGLAPLPLYLQPGPDWVMSSCTRGVSQDSMILAVFDHGLWLKYEWTMICSKTLELKYALACNWLGKLAQVFAFVNGCPPINWGFVIKCFGIYPDEGSCRWPQAHIEL